MFSGVWLAINGEAIYNTKPWSVQNDTLTGSVWYTQSKDEKQLYASILQWPDDDTLHLGSLKISQNSQIYLLGYPSTIEVSILFLLSYITKITITLYLNFFSGNKTMRK